MKRTYIYPYPKFGSGTNSETAFEQIRKWIDTCLETHSDCGRDLASYQTPTRLVHIDWLKKRIRVLESVGTSLPYVTLSYRWGSGQPAYKLTAATRFKLTSESGESMEQLPKTIYDACLACHQLGYSHLWVDRLCIVQDCKEDWAREASKMSQVYRNSVFTISASRASDEHQSLFTEGRHLNFQPFHLKTKPSETEPHKTLVIEPCNRDDADRKGMLGHLGNRGWVFQERLLSKRTVYYTDEQLYWECSTLKANELWPEGASHDWSMMAPYHRLYYPPSTSTVLTRRCEGKCRCGVEDLVPGQDPWHKIVKHYTERVFTLDEDRLPGFSGLATDFKKNHRDDQDEYYAGLWKSNIIDDLCWSTTAPSPALPVKYRAPSWSWASIESKVTYNQFCAQKPTSLIDIKVVHLSYASDDCHGAVCDGWIHLSGHLKPVTISLFEHDGGQDQMRGPDNEELGIFRGDPVSLDRQALGPRGQMFCLPLMRSTRCRALTVDCLLLVPKGAMKYPEPTQKLSKPVKVGADEFQRVGTFAGKVVDETALAQ